MAAACCTGSEFRKSPNMCLDHRVCTYYECDAARLWMNGPWSTTLSQLPGVNCTANPIDSSFNSGNCSNLLNGQIGFDGSKGLMVGGSGGYVQYQFASQLYVQQVIVQQVPNYVTPEFQVWLLKNNNSNATLDKSVSCVSESRVTHSIRNGGAFATGVRIVLTGKPPMDTWARLMQISVRGKVKGMPWRSSGAKSCEPCVTGSYCAPGSSSAGICTPGLADLDSDPATPCQQCPLGTSTSCGALTCPRCPKGTVDADHDPSTQCTDCVPGRVYVPDVPEACAPRDPCTLSSGNSTNQQPRSCSKASCVHTPLVKSRPQISATNESCIAKDPCLLKDGCSGFTCHYTPRNEEVLESCKPAPNETVVLNSHSYVRNAVQVA
jgi:hypothetical protein